MRACSAFTVLLLVLTLAACGKPGTTANSSAPSQPAAASSESAADEPAGNEPEKPTPRVVPTTSNIKKVDASGFTLGDYLPPLNGGRIEIAPPVDWNPMPRDSKYVVRFYKGSRNSLPRIDVVVEEKNLAGLTSVTESNVSEFTAAVAKELEAAGTAVVEPPIPMVIGSVPCARYVSLLKLKIGEGTIPVERQTLALLHSGQLYKINLLVMPQKLSESRDAAYTICSGVRFLASESPAATE